MKKIKLPVIILIAVGTIISTIYAFDSDDKNFQVSKQLSIYAAILREVNMFYVDETKPENLVTPSINAMLKDLDPYTVYYQESDKEDLKLMTTGEYAGIGSIISKKGDNVIIREPYKNSPSDKAGLLPGDVIISVDGKSALNKNTSDVSEMLLGHAGKEVIVQVQRKGIEKPIEKKIIRQKIQLPSVPFYTMMNDSIGYIVLNQFIDKSAADVRAAISNLKTQGCKSIIIDLRGNGGGLLDQAVEISNFFLPKNTLIVNTKGKISQWDSEYKTKRDPIAANIPLAILVDRSSASASEILSGAMQDYDRAVIIGERTFGKGLVQSVRELPYNASLKITTAKYYIPSGRCIQALDYSHRNDDGSVGKVPDSLITAYTTKAGRIVYDGGGIVPDITTTNREYARITQELLFKDLYFDFVSEYALTHPQIAAIKDFKITDELYNEFKKYVKDQKFTYDTDSQEQLEKLIETAKNEKYFEDSAEQFEILKQNMNHSVDRDMNSFRNEISELLAAHIIQRYYYNEGTAEYRTLDDEEIKKALEILSNPQQYQEILSKQKEIK